MNFLGAMGGIGRGISGGAESMRAADEAKKNDAYKQAQLGIMQAQDTRAQAADTRSQATHDAQMQVTNQALADDKKNRSTLEIRLANFKKIMAGDQAATDEAINEYNQNQGVSNDGHTIEFTQSTSDGGRAGWITGPDGRKTPISMTRQQMGDKYMQGTAMELGFNNPKQFLDYITSNADAREKQAERDKSKFISVGDGQMGDTKTGQVTGTRIAKPFSVAPGGTVMMPQPDGSVKQVYQAPHKPLAADGDGGLPAEAKLVDYYTKVHGMKPEDARKFVKSSKENTPESHKAKLIASVSANNMMSSKQKAAAIAEGSAMIDALYGGVETPAPGAKPSGAAQEKEKKAIDWSKY